MGFKPETSFHFASLRERARHLANAERAAARDGGLDDGEATGAVVALARELARPFASLEALDGKGVLLAEKLAAEWIRLQRVGLETPPRAYITAELRNAGYALTDVVSEPEGA